MVSPSRGVVAREFHELGGRGVSARLEGNWRETGRRVATIYLSETKDSIFGATLDVSRYGKNDREKAAADLAFEILKKRRRPSWLGAAPGCGSMPNMCSMPSFPVVDGREVYYCVGGQKMKA